MGVVGAGIIITLTELPGYDQINMVGSTRHQMKFIFGDTSHCFNFDTVWLSLFKCVSSTVLYAM